MPNEVKDLRLKAKSLQKQLTKENKEIFDLLESLFVLYEQTDEQLSKLSEVVFNKKTQG